MISWFSSNARHVPPSRHVFKKLYVADIMIKKKTQELIDENLGSNLSNREQKMLGL
jgi:hypothetical protein